MTYGESVALVVLACGALTLLWVVFSSLLLLYKRGWYYWWHYDERLLLLFPLSVVGTVFGVAYLVRLYTQ